MNSMDPINESDESVSVFTESTKNSMDPMGSIGSIKFTQFILM